MNMLGLMDRLTYIHLLMLYFFVSIHGRREGLFPRCEVMANVRRGTTVKKIPQQSVTVSCPVVHCGKSLNVTWCKLSNTGRCQQIGNTENVEIRQDGHLKDKLISYLTFKQISVYDDGLYRCELHGLANGESHISHHINISVSDMHQGLESDGSIAAASLNQAVDESASWHPYFYICGGIALLVFTLTALTLLQFYGCQQVPNNKATQNQTQYVLNDIYSASALAPPPLITDGKQPLESTANKHREDAVINHAQSEISASKQHVATEQDKDPQYPAILCVSPLGEE
ncbi:B- and T-lymphocyte attenuator isoform X2 [Solea solea]|uniref:B- and T-lymphocyte attenuator isoform X2 n=1 Tax=Solea solea TaxID=90069 RepID=UPI00272966A1|nr:B- and T-lymphocyte attenuator isoform X2 [Solea solea]